MPDLVDLFVRWWKKILFIVIASLLLAAIVVLKKSKKYLSVATAVPASTFASDKGKIFNENIQELYSTLGTPDDLDVVSGLGTLDTLYLTICDKLSLPQYYHTNGTASRQDAADRLKKNSKVYKSEYGNLKVKVWDKEKDMAAKMANELMSQLQKMFQQIQSAGNIAILDGLLTKKKEMLNKVDSLNLAPDEGRTSQMLQYDKLINEYQLMVENKPPALIIVENARPAQYYDQPKILLTLVATAVLSFLFALLTAIVIDIKKTH